MNKTKPNKLLFSNQFFFILIIKIILLALFNSYYNKNLFYPFLNTFISESLNPWNNYYSNHLNIDAFPYHGLMLYLLYPFAFLGKITGLGSILIKIPLLIADILIYFILNKIIKNKNKLIIMFYFFNPIIIYATYVHSQLDLIPTAFMLICIYYLIGEKHKYSAIFLGLALSTKLHVAIAVPLIFFYIFKIKNFQLAINYTIFSVLILFFFD